MAVSRGSWKFVEKTMDNQISLAILLVEELRKRQAIEDVICEYGIETVRICNHCNRLMNEGWMYHDFKTYCSDGCMLRDNPDEDIMELYRHACEEDCVAYWTKWEG